MSGVAPSKALADAKVKRQKQIVAVGSVILLALLGFELPKVLGGGSAQTAPATISTAPSLPGSPLAVAPGKLPDTDRVVIEPQTGQLLSFGLFKSKDPFVQQLSTNAAALSSAATPAPSAPVVTTSQQRRPSVPAAPAGGTATVTTTAASTSPASTVPLSSTTPVAAAPAAPAATTPAATTPAVSATAPTSVAISTNGACENVALNGTFPGNEDIFRVVSIARDGKSVKIAVVGGAYDNGQAAATLKLGEKLTLVNTADGTRYVIVLKSKCDVQTQPVSKTSTTPAATTPAATTTTATTPIVTDSLDTTTPTG